MTSKTPEDLRSFNGGGAGSVDGALRWDGGDRPGIQTARPEAAGDSTGESSRYGALKQNLTSRWQVQDR